MNDHRRMTRREFGRRTAALTVAAAVPAGCGGGGKSRYDALVAQTWRHAAPIPGEHAAVMREIARCGTLAANSHNTQPWLFELGDHRILIRPDYARRTPVVDPDDHHLFASLGCAAENIVQAAPAYGLSAEAVFDPAEDAVDVRFVESTSRRSRLFDAITSRQSTRAEYDGRAVPAGELAALEAAAADESTALRLFTDRGAMEDILDFVVAGNTSLIENEAFVEELEEWLRFNARSAVEHRDGLYAAASGNPTLPSFLGHLMFDFVFTAGAENDRYREHIRSSSGLAAFVAGENSRCGWVAAGRSLQRFALEATALGLKHAHVNTLVEAPDVREQFADWLGIGGTRPDFLVRFGYGPEMPRSLRRPLDAVIVTR